MLERSRTKRLRPSRARPNALAHSILTSCAVRGIETAGGAVSAVVTEHGTIRTSTVLCAGGAWTSMFCRSIGIRLPQLRVRGTVSRTAPGPDVLESSVFCEYVGIRRRQDRGYTIAHGRLLDHFMTPSTLRFSMTFLPALIKEFRSLHVSIGREFLDEWRAPKVWDLDNPSPFESRACTEPGTQSQARQIRRSERLGIAFPALERHRVRRVLGRHGRNDARCNSSHRPEPGTRLLHRDGIQRPRLRHRAGRRQGGSRAVARRHAIREHQRSDAEPIFRWHAHPTAKNHLN